MYALNWTHDRKTRMIMVTIGEDQSHLKMTKQLQGAANFFVRTRKNNSWITHYLVNWRADDPQLWNCQSFHEWSMWFLTYFLAQHIFYAKNLRAWLLRVHKNTWQGGISSTVSVFSPLSSLFLLFLFVELWAVAHALHCHGWESIRNSFWRSVRKSYWESIRKLFQKSFVNRSGNRSVNQSISKSF